MNTGRRLKVLAGQSPWKVPCVTEGGFMNFIGIKDEYRFAKKRKFIDSILGYKETVLKHYSLHFLEDTDHLTSRLLRLPIDQSLL